MNTGAALLVSSVLFAGAVLVHAVAGRYEFAATPGGVLTVTRLDRLTGRVVHCVPRQINLTRAESQAKEAVAATEVPSDQVPAQLSDEQSKHGAKNLGERERARREAEIAAWVAERRERALRERPTRLAQAAKGYDALLAEFTAAELAPGPVKEWLEFQCDPGAR